MRKFLTKTNIAIGGILAALILTFLVVNAQTTPETSKEVVKADIESISKEQEADKVDTQKEKEKEVNPPAKSEEEVDTNPEDEENEENEDTESKDEEKKEVTENDKKEDTTKKEVVSNQPTTPVNKSTGSTDSKKVVTSTNTTQTTKSPTTTKTTSISKEEVKAPTPKAPAATKSPAPAPPKKEEPAPAPPKKEEPAPAPPKKEEPAPAPTPPPAPKPAPAPAPTPSLPPVPAGNTALMSAVHEKINQERVKAGVPPLKLVKGIQDVALIKAKDMADNNYFDHISPTYGGPAQMLKMAGITLKPGGENISAVANTADEIVGDWMNSPGHRSNILSPTYKYTGIGIYVGGSYGIYSVQIFAY